MTHRGPFQPLPFCDSVILWVHRSRPLTAALCWVSQPQPVLGPRGWPGRSRGPPVPLPCSEHLTRGLRAFPVGTCTPSSAWLPGWPADHRALQHVCFGQRSPPASSGQGRVAGPSPPSPVMGQRCLRTSGWSRVQPGLRSRQSRQTPGSCRGVGFGDPPQRWVLPWIHPGRGIRVTPQFHCSENPKSCSFSSWVMLQGVSSPRAAAPGTHVGSPAPSAGLGSSALACWAARDTAAQRNGF